MKKLFIFLFFICTSVSFSQKRTGLILDFQTKKPIEKAHIFFIDRVIYSDNNGKFSFNLKRKKEITFSISHLKYNSQNFTVKKTDSTNTFFLKEKEVLLNEININSKQNLQDKIQFSRLENMPIATYSFASIIDNDKIYVFGGNASSSSDRNKECLDINNNTNTFEEILKCINRPKPISFNNYIGDIQFYDLKTKNWSTKNNKIIKRANYKAISYKEEVYLIGGKKLSKKKTRELLENNIEIVSTKDFSIKKDETNPHQAVDFGASIYDNKVIIFGGSTKLLKNGRKKYSNEIHFYDLESGYWYLLTKMSKGKEVNGIVFNDKLYLFGGFNGSNLSEIESFNFITSKWIKEGKLFEGIKNPAISKDKELIYVYENGKLITFNPKTSTIKEYNIDLNLKGLGMHFFNEQLYLIGGYNVESFEKSPSKGFYSIDVLEFLKTKPLRVRHLTKSLIK